MIARHWWRPGFNWFGVGRVGGGKASGSRSGAAGTGDPTTLNGVGVVMERYCGWSAMDRDGRKVMVGVVYINPEGVRVEETKNMYGGWNK